MAGIYLQKSSLFQKKRMDLCNDANNYIEVGGVWGGGGSAGVRDRLYKINIKTSKYFFFK